MNEWRISWGMFAQGMWQEHVNQDKNRKSQFPYSVSAWLHVPNPYPRFSQDRVLSARFFFFYLCLIELNCFTVDPNKDRREAVKRKTTQYLKRAEEIFITHLQDNLGKGSSHLGVRFYEPQGTLHFWECSVLVGQYNNNNNNNMSSLR